MKLIPRTRLDLTGFGLICVPLKPISKDIEYLLASPDRNKISQYTFLADWSSVPVVTTLPSEPKQSTKSFDGNSSGISVITLPNVGVGCGETYFVTGGMDGSIILYRISDQDIVHVVTTLKYQSAPITSLRFSPEGLRLLSTSLDGSTIVFTLQGSLTEQVTRSIENVSKSSKPSDLELTALEALTETYYETDAENKAESEPAIVNVIKIVDREKINEINKTIAHKKGVLNEIHDALQDLLIENREVTDLQRLERSEFVIDVLEYNKRKEENVKRRNELQEQLENTNYSYQLLLEKYKNEFWDSMEVHAISLFAFKSGIGVRNFPIPKQTTKEIMDVF